MSDESDAKQILTASPRNGGDHRHAPAVTWIKTTQQDGTGITEPLPE